jgi:hypothetical protein
VLEAVISCCPLAHPRATGVIVGAKLGVGVAVAVWVAVAVGNVPVGVGVGVVGVLVRVGVLVGVGRVGVFVTVRVMVGVEVFVDVGVAVWNRRFTSPSLSCRLCHQAAPSMCP